jgi:hypothetical protein
MLSQTIILIDSKLKSDKLLAKLPLKILFLSQENPSVLISWVYQALEKALSQNTFLPSF